MGIDYDPIVEMTLKLEGIDVAVILAVYALIRYNEKDEPKDENDLALAGYSVEGMAYLFDLISDNGPSLFSIYSPEKLRDLQERFEILAKDIKEYLET